VLEQLWLGFIGLRWYEWKTIIVDSKPEVVARRREDEYNPETGQMLVTDENGNMKLFYKDEDGNLRVKEKDQDGNILDRNPNPSEYFNEVRTYKEQANLEGARLREVIDIKEALKDFKRAENNKTEYLDSSRSEEYKVILNGISDSGNQSSNIDLNKPLFGIGKYYLEDKSIGGEKRFLFAKEGANFINSASQSNPGWHKYTQEATAETLARALKTWEKKSPDTLFYINDLSWRTKEKGGRQGLNHHPNGTEIDMKFLSKKEPSLPSGKFNSPQNNYDRQMTIEFINDMQKSLPKGYKLFVKFGDDSMEKALKKNKFIDFHYDDTGKHDDHLHFQVMKISDTDRMIREIK
jgi:hypothetical protein